MTKEFTYSSRSKATVTTNGGESIAVIRNHEGVYEPASKDILFLNPELSKSMSFDLDQAKRLYYAIGEVIADAEQIIEDAKPDLLDEAELLALERGTIVKFPEGAENTDGYADTKWMRLGWGGPNADFVKINSDLVGTVNSAWALRDKLIVSTKEEN